MKKSWIRTANASTSMDMLPKLLTLTVLWMVLGPVGKDVPKNKDGRMLSKLPTLAVLWTLLGSARI